MRRARAIESAAQRQLLGQISPVGPLPRGRPIASASKSSTIENTATTSNQGGTRES